MAASYHTRNMMALPEFSWHIWFRAVNHATMQSFQRRNGFICLAQLRAVFSRPVLGKRLTMPSCNAHFDTRKLEGGSFQLNLLIPNFYKIKTGHLLRVDKFLNLFARLLNARILELV